MTRTLRRSTLINPRRSKSARSLFTVIRVDPTAAARSSCVSGSGRPRRATSTRYFARRLVTSRKAKSSTWPSSLRMLRERRSNMCRRTSSLRFNTASDPSRSIWKTLVGMTQTAVPSRGTFSSKMTSSPKNSPREWSEDKELAPVLVEEQHLDEPLEDDEPVRRGIALVIDDLVLLEVPEGHVTGELLTIDLRK